MSKVVSFYFGSVLHERKNSGPNASVKRGLAEIRVTIRTHRGALRPHTKTKKKDISLFKCPCSERGISFTESEGI